MKSVENTGQSGGAQFKFSVTDCEGEFNVVVVSCTRNKERIGVSSCRRFCCCCAF